MRLAAAVLDGGRGELRRPAEMAAIGDGAEGGFGQACRPEVAVVVFEQHGSNQPVSGRMLRRVAERSAGAVLSRTGEGAVQHRARREVKRFGVCRRQRPISRLCSRPARGRSM